MADPVVKEKFLAVGSETTPTGPEAFGAFMQKRRPDFSNT